MRAKTLFCALVLAGGVLAPGGGLTAVQHRGEASRQPLPNFDAREGTLPAPAAAAERDARRENGQASRHHPHTGAIRVLGDPDVSLQPGASPDAVRELLSSLAGRLGLEDGDLASLTLVRDYVTASNGLRHVIFAQSFAGIPVLDGIIAAHIDSGGEVLRVTSSAARGAERANGIAVASAAAARIAAGNIRPDQAYTPRSRGGNGGARQHALFDRGPFLRDVTAQLTWVPVNGRLQLAWRVSLEPDGDPQFYDVLVGAAAGDVLLRRNRVLNAEGTGRVIQSAATQAIDPRRPDENPTTAAACPPVAGHEVRDLTLPFLDAASVLGNTGRLDGNNAHIYHGNATTEAPQGTFDGGQWSFDFPFESVGGGATTLFFALNYAHDFFYDLGFTEAAGNFQQNNFGRGGAGNDPVKAIARAAGRNNASIEVDPVDGNSPTISMFMWDGAGCWAQDLDGDGSIDLDGDYDLDIVLHEFHHGVNHRLNTAFSGNEADAIGEGASDFFAYSVNGNTTLAEYSRPGGLRSVNGKTYGDWFCLLGFFCEPHGNGEIFANVLWDVRQRFRADLVRGSEGAAINESHQLYIDGLTLSPPSPTMLDMRDAIVLADSVRNPGSPRSENFCRIWEAFSARGMGVAARDTADHGANVVTADFSVPAGCNAPPPPPTITLAVITAAASEAGPTSGRFRVSRGTPQTSTITVQLTIGGTAKNGTDYASIPASVTIQPDAAAADVVIAPIDDSLLESNESVTLTLRAGSTYVLGSPSSGSVTIASDDVAPDFVVSALTAPQEAAAGQTISVTDTTKNQGTGPGASSVTSFHLSANFQLDAADHALGSRTVPALAVGEVNTATTSVALPAPLTPGVYYLFAKADGPAGQVETQESNNLRSVQVRVGPDLLVTTLTVPSVVGAGVAFNVTDLTTNQGAEAADATQTRFYLSSNYQWDSGDTPLQSRNVPALAGEGSSSATTSLTIPAGTATGQYYLLARADAGEAVPESSETNNVKFVLVHVGPDLQISSLSVPVTGRSGGTVAVTETTRNAGGGGAGASTTAFYLSADNRLDGTDHRLTPARTVGALAGGASSSAVTTVTLPAVAAGRWYLLAAADDLAAVAETQEANNTRYGLISIGPDLDLTLLSAPSTATAGTSITISDTVKNVGADPAGPSITRLYLSLDTTLDGSDTPIGDRAVGALGPNLTSVGPTTVAVPGELSGRYYIIAMTDAAGAVAESNESNNAYARAITIYPQ